MRRAVLRLTPKGGRINSTAKVTVEAAVSRVLGGISKSDEAGCRRVLQEVASELEPRPAKTRTRSSTTQRALIATGEAPGQNRCARPPTFRCQSEVSRLGFRSQKNTGTWLASGQLRARWGAST